MSKSTAVENRCAECGGDLGPTYYVSSSKPGFRCSKCADRKAEHAEKKSLSSCESEWLANARAADKAVYDPPLDPGIELAVRVLRSGGIETYQSCEGGDGHAFPEPTIQFHGGPSAGFKALSVAMEHSLPVVSLRRFWNFIDGEPIGPEWEMTFSRSSAKRGKTK